MVHNERSIDQPSRGEGGEAVFRAALEAFATDGYNGASVRQIAAAAGVSVSVIYHHYGNKQDLLYEIITVTTTALAQTLESAISSSKTGVEHRLIAVVTAMARFYATRTQECKLINAEMRYLTAANYRRHLRLRRHVQGVFEAIVGDGCAQRAFRVQNQKIAVRAIVVLCRDISSWFDPGGSWSVEDVADHYVRMALDLVEPASSPYLRSVRRREQAPAPGK